MGGVLLDIDYHRTRDAFMNLGVTNFEEFYGQTLAIPLFANLERGLVEPDEFRQQLKKLSGVDLDDETIDTAWNAMLGPFHEKSLAYMATLENDYKLYLLSNTNVIHYARVLSIHTRQFGNALFDERFHKAYFSHRTGQRKPDPESFKIVLEENNLHPEETLFIDDTYKNIPPAEALGIQGLLLQNGTPAEEALEQRLRYNQ